ncbi:hypothetical protein BZA05DRAFT_468212 [Tricharina praecox]|uniref:uncharacterized protein n=1 Tax=Tricharina praecox TaxID=43433 RepID=UPI00221F8978|nr:uncharacterized protein BZA05DRAFT_468212 [Tricharina praecox]KAI5853695.1 hypothetical protein BZA05DRAFT_468212 [Tricharina praecox]
MSQLPETGGPHPSPQQVIAIKGLSAILMSMCFVLRYSIHRKLPQNFNTRLCNLLIAGAIVLDMGSSVSSIWVMTEEIKEPYRFQVWGLTEKVRKALYATHTLYFLSLAFIKGAYLVYFAELARGAVHSRKRYLSHIAAAIYISTTFVGLFMLLLWCRPFYHNYRGITFKNYLQCPSQYNRTVFITTSVLNIISDLAILAVPFTLITTLFRFESSRCFKRAALLFVFAVGVLSIVATAVRMAVILGNLDSFGLLPWGLMRTAMVLSHVEVFAAILAITLPSVGKVVAVAVGARCDPWIAAAKTGAPLGGGAS